MKPRAGSSDASPAGALADVCLGVEGGYPYVVGEETWSPNREPMNRSPSR